MVASDAARVGGPPPVLGTVQLGTAYGAANTSGMPSADEALAILCRAAALGVAAYDTARAYGDAEARIGAALGRLAGERPAIITKLAPQAESAGPRPSESELVARVDRSLDASFAALGVQTVDAVLLHREADRTAWNGAVWRRLIHHRDAGRIGRIGVSVQSPAELAGAIADPDVAQVQLPFNLLDHRWADAGAPALFAARPDLRVHVRSVFLQGLLVGGKGARWPQLAGLDPAILLASLDAIAARFARAGRADLCVAYVRAHGWVDGVVVGVETRDQLERTLALFDNPPLSAEARDAVRRAVPQVPPDLLDPARWSRDTA